MWNKKLSVRAESPDNLHNTLQATISERGALTRVKIDISGCQNVLSIPWHAIDEAIQESLPHLDIFEVECFHSWEEVAFDVQGLARTICAMTPNLAGSRKLVFWDNEIGDTKGRARIVPGI